MRHAIVFVVFAVATGVAGCGDHLDRKRLVGKIKDLHALAAETRMLTELEERQGTPRPFARVHRRMLIDKVEQARADLDQPVVDPDLGPLLVRARALGDALEPAVRDGAGLHRLLELETELVRLEHAAEAP